MSFSVRASFGSAMAIALAVCVLGMVIFLENIKQGPIEAAGKVQVFPLKKWQLSGSQARKQMSNYFNRENFNAEAKHLANFVDNHPFFGEGSGRFMLSGNKQPRFAVVGFGRPHAHTVLSKQHGTSIHKRLRSMVHRLRK